MDSIQTDFFELTLERAVKKMRVDLLLFSREMLLSAFLFAAGCNTWQSGDSRGMWETGTTSAAGWQTTAGRGALGAITVLDSAPTSNQRYDANYVETAYNAVGQLLASARPAIVGDDEFDFKLPILYFSTVDLNDYRHTSDFGRLMSEALATALNQHWRNTIVKQTLSQGFVSIVPAPPNSGEYVLSRNIDKLALDFNAGTAFVSTYSVAVDKVYVNIELINTHHNNIVASTMFALPLGPRTRALLETKSAGPN